MYDRSFIPAITLIGILGGMIEAAAIAGILGTDTEYKIEKPYEERTYIVYPIKPGSVSGGRR
jgi:hypothetical protein